MIFPHTGHSISSCSRFPSHMDLSSLSRVSPREVSYELWFITINSCSQYTTKFHPFTAIFRSSYLLPIPIYLQICQKTSRHTAQPIIDHIVPLEQPTHKNQLTKFYGCRYSYSHQKSLMPFHLMIYNCRK